ncbi:acyltransferase family protein [Dactylosporangium sp. CA-092794]|uniref:acyltransferase family protein n=1 Tax=Dactylosporangium sp. CA-092794 TaxID=3239929 RepID=UPI003D8EB5DA
MRLPITTPRGLPTLAERYSPRQNAFGALRLAFAVAVLVAHAWSLGYGKASPGYWLTSTQTELGAFALYGFFLISGFLVTDSALRSSLAGYLWARCVRVFPGLWACLLVTAFVFAPAVALYERGTLDGFANAPDGPLRYVAVNWLGSMDQYTISGLLSTTPFGRLVHGPSAFDGALWTLRYDLAFYGVVAVLVVTGALRGAPRVVPVLAAGCYVLILRDLFSTPGWTVRPPAHGSIHVPLAGSFAADWTLYLGFVFLLGVALRLYAHRIPVHAAVAAAAAVVLAGSLWLGGFIAVGIPAYAYLVVYAAVTLPSSRTAGRRDYTYGMYIYGFPVQQSLALLGANRFGVAAFIAFSLLGTLGFAVLSWHLVERPALRWKQRRAVSGQLVPAREPDQPHAGEAVATR